MYSRNSFVILKKLAYGETNGYGGENIIAPVLTDSGARHRYVWGSETTVPNICYSKITGKLLAPPLRY